MDTQTTGECLVCGNETKNRCSRCLEAGLDVFFCSPEHQKMVWFAHRAVCGPGKANPPLFPELTPAELADVLTRRDVQVPALAITTESSAARAHPDAVTLANLFELHERDSFEHIAESASGPVNDCSKLPNKPLVLAHIRSACLSGSISSSVSLRPTFIIDQVSKLLSRISTHLVAHGVQPRQVTSTSWWSPLVHRLYVLAALVKLALETRDDTYMALVPRAEARLAA
ncbi:hypothetical protein AAT19DRAFT_16327 [Rhodotorula toruloides]|uniref:MYND-type domain-containing protein n=1 Tax=Rhodotorula toruloides TaxID=5286 RepID=A0A2T0A336_RHOTO|nr:hypothetical protein AAT19DRAFT_16327 [Rhodotorula toruloides]